MEERTIKPTAGKFLPKGRKKARGLVAVAVVLVLGAALILPALPGGKEKPQLDLTDTTVLTYTDLRSTVSATGTVESAETTMVYSTAAYPVMAVHVEVGDYVKAGDLLAELDDHSIRNQITSQQISLDQSIRSSNQQVLTAQEAYDNYKSGLDQGLNSTLNNARNQVDSAYNSYEKALTTYNRYRNSLNEGENTGLISAENAYLSASDALDAAEETYDSAYDSWKEANRLHDGAEDAHEAAADALAEAEETLSAYEAELEALTAVAPEEQTEEQLARVAELELLLAEQEALLPALQQEEQLTRAALDQALMALTETELRLDAADQTLTQARRTYNTQLANYNATVTNVDHTLADYLTNVQTAWESYENALTALASTEKSVNEQLRSYENSLTSAQINAGKGSAEESLRQLEENLQDTQVTAPVSGTVTAVYATVGGTGSGLLFVIEDVDNLIVNTSVKGYDVGTVQPGMDVIIRSDATGDREMSGVLTSIAPTSNKNSMGKTDTTGEAVFAAEVAVTEAKTGLRIGMEARLDYILAEESHVLAVPYDAVYEDDMGRTCLLIAEPAGEADQYHIRAIPVTTGMDDDLDMEVTGQEVREGLRVINEPDTYLHLLGQTVLAGSGLQNELVAAMMGGSMG